MPVKANEKRLGIQCHGLLPLHSQVGAFLRNMSLPFFDLIPKVLLSISRITISHLPGKLTPWCFAFEYRCMHIISQLRVFKFCVHNFLPLLFLQTISQLSLEYITRLKCFTPGINIESFCDFDARKHKIKQNVIIILMSLYSNALIRFQVWRSA